MTLSDLQNLNKEDILAKIGLEMKRSTASRLTIGFELFGLGVLVGAGIALLVAPKSGRELREDIQSKLRYAPEEITTS